MKSRFMLALVLGALPASPNWGQEVHVYSEFAKLDARGNVTAPESPREILSPALARNAFNSFQVVIQAPPGTRTSMFVGQNPEGAVKVTLYKRDGDALQPAALPYESAGTQILWMDVWVDKDAPVRRVKVEPQVLINEDWVIYPIEARVRDVQVPDGAPKDAGVLDPFSTLQGALCGARASKPAPPELTANRLHYRNALQDAALAGQASAADREELKKRMGGCSAKPPADPEFYLKLRDYFFTPLWMKIKGN